ncbi:MAG: helix-turn-helix domain-containing protein [Candidatus Woesearchaeota archaeon]|nr:helix-turn-helix domain-containing protein [Candidatus Woesearchaeota archaeon]
MEEELRDYGLSEKEIKVYVACLKAGACTANRISELADLRRGTTYDILESLKEKGLISSFKSGKKSHFQATEPKELLVLLKEKERRLAEIIPSLEKIKSSVIKKPEIVLFEGFKGVLTMLEELYKEKEILLYGSAEKVAQVLRHIPKAFALKRAREKIFMRIIFEHSEDAEFRMKDPRIEKVTKMRFVEEMKKFPTVTLIAGEKVGIIPLERELIAILIKNKETSETQRLIFENYWRQATK